MDSADIYQQAHAKKKTRIELEADDGSEDINPHPESKQGAKSQKDNTIKQVVHEVSRGRDQRGPALEHLGQGVKRPRAHDGETVRFWICY